MGGPPMSGNSNANGAREGTCGRLVGRLALGIVAAPNKKTVRNKTSRNRYMFSLWLEWRASTLKAATHFRRVMVCAAVVFSEAVVATPVESLVFLLISRPAVGSVPFWRRSARCL